MNQRLFSEFFAKIEVSSFMKLCHEYEIQVVPSDGHMGQVDVLGQSRNPKELELFRGFKLLLDPKNILGPGK